MSRGGERTMDITLVTSSYDKVVHGTENDKKTGCGINLLKSENVTGKYISRPGTRNWALNRRALIEGIPFLKLRILSASMTPT